MLKKLTKYFGIGVMATGIYLGLLYIFTDFIKIHYIISAILAFTTSTTFAFFGHKHVTFKNKEKEHLKQFINFTIIAISGLIVNTLGIYFFVEILNLWYMIGAIITSGIVFIWNFALNNFITFKEKTSRLDNLAPRGSSGSHV